MNKKQYKINTLLVAGAILLAGGTLSASRSEEIKEAKKEANEKAKMEAMTKAGKPGKEHLMLAALAGNWKTTVKTWEVPGKEPAESKGESVIKTVLGGRFVEETLSSETMGKPYEGFGLTGFDNVEQVYVGTWCDNFGTTIMMMTGTYDGSSKTFEYAGKYTDPVTKRMKTMKMTTKIVDANNHLHEFFVQAPDGKFDKTMEMKYTRK